MNDLMVVEKSTFPEINLEDSNMVGEFVKVFANALTKASDLAGQLAALRDEMVELRRQVSSANHSREVADAAYNAVNAQRIQAENECHSLRGELNTYIKAEADAQIALGDTKAKVVELEAEIVKLVNDSNETIASANAKRTAAEAKAKDFEDLYNLALADIENLKREKEAAQGASECWCREYTTVLEKLNTANEKLSAVRKALEAIEGKVEPVETSPSPPTAPEVEASNAQPRVPAGSPEGGQWTKDTMFDTI